MPGRRATLEPKTPHRLGKEARIYAPQPYGDVPRVGVCRRHGAGPGAAGRVPHQLACPARHAQGPSSFEGSSCPETLLITNADGHLPRGVRRGPRFGPVRVAHDVDRLACRHLLESSENFVDNWPISHDLRAIYAGAACPGVIYSLIYIGRHYEALRSENFPLLACSTRGVV